VAKTFAQTGAFVSILRPPSIEPRS
jgi:hypothetical protein